MGYLLGIDGGGTRTHAVVANTDGEILGAAQGGPSNLLSVGEAAARDNISKAIQGAIVRALEDEARIVSCRPWRLEVACAGFAGADRPQVRQTLERILEDLQGKALVELHTDAEIALAGAHGTGPGIIVISGTGSIVLGRGADGKLVRCGGWGWLLGDEGSGTVVARRAISRALLELDGRAEVSALSEAVKSHFAVDSVRDVVWKIHFENTPAAQLSAFFPRVLEAARSGDAAALEILEDAGRSLGELVESVARQLEAPPGGWNVAYTGSVLTYSGPTLKAMEDWLNGRLKCTVRAPLGLPVEGAIRLAAEAFRRAS